MKTAKEWEKEILNLMLKDGGATTEVKQSVLITDVRELFDHDLKEKVSLRTADDHQQGRPVLLKQFQPNFQPGKVVCRHPVCKNVNPEVETKNGKRDLYLCPDHRMKLGDFIKKMCARKKVRLIRRVARIFLSFFLDGGGGGGLRPVARIFHGGRGVRTSRTGTK